MSFHGWSFGPFWYTITSKSTHTSPHSTITLHPRLVSPSEVHFINLLWKKWGCSDWSIRLYIFSSLKTSYNLDDTTNISTTSVNPELILQTNLPLAWSITLRNLTCLYRILPLSLPRDVLFSCNSLSNSTPSLNYNRFIARNGSRPVTKASIVSTDTQCPSPDPATACMKCSLSTRPTPPDSSLARMMVVQLLLTSRAIFK